MNHIQYLGKIYGCLEVIGIGPTNKHRKKLLLVKCLKHPNVKPYHVVKQSLVNGSSKSCPECIRESRQTHGKSKTRIYHIYKGILQRIKNSNHKNYKDYGGRGIDIDPKYDPNHNNQGITKAF